MQKIKSKSFVLIIPILFFSGISFYIFSLIFTSLKFDLSNKDICLSGFSQGCMMSLNVGLTSDEKFSCIVGFSGKIIDKDNLKNRIKNKTETLLIHGDTDQIVPSINLLEAKDFLIRNNVKVDTLLIKNCDHHIPIQASSTALNYILKKL